MSNENSYKLRARGSTGGWEKYPDAVLGGPLGTCFDVDVKFDQGKYRMWFSWRPVNLIALTESGDGIHWTPPQVVFPADPDSSWESSEVNRPTIVIRDGVYHMWYCGQVFADEFHSARTCIGYAVSSDGVTWTRRSEPVMEPQLPWEKYCLLCPHVLWDEERQVYRMWYSAGEMYEADAIGYAESKDGITWERHPENPIFRPDPQSYWESTKVEACFVFPHDGWYYMFYLGMDGDLIATNGLARSRDGITGWERHPDNPILAGTDGTWDNMGICKAVCLPSEDGFIAWYNGAGRRIEQVGVAYHRGTDLWPKDPEHYVPERGVCNFTGPMNYKLGV